MKPILVSTFLRHWAPWQERACSAKVPPISGCDWRKMPVKFNEKIQCASLGSNESETEHQELSLQDTQTPVGLKDQKSSVDGLQKEESSVILCCSNTVESEEAQCWNGTQHAEKDAVGRTGEIVRWKDTPAKPVDSADGLLIATVAICSGILGRLSAQELRYDAARLYRNQENSRSMSLELRRKREAWKQEEDARMAGEQQKRVQEVTERALKEVERQKKIQEKYEKVRVRLVICNQIHQGS